MLRSLLDSSAVPLLKQVARFTERRQEVLAGNIANIDTPGYHMRDLPVADFQRALQAAVSDRQRQPTVSPSQYSPLPVGAGVAGESPVNGAPLLGPLSLQQPPTAGTATAPPPAGFSESLFAARELTSQPGITFQDNNNRFVETQFVEMNKNLTLQNFAIEVMNQQYSQLQLAISERVS